MAVIEQRLGGMAVQKLGDKLRITQDTTRSVSERPYSVHLNSFLSHLLHFGVCVFLMVLEYLKIT